MKIERHPEKKSKANNMEFWTVRWQGSNGKNQFSSPCNLNKAEAIYRKKRGKSPVLVQEFYGTIL